MFVADGFRSMTERLDSLTPVHDFGCLFLDCAARNVPAPAKSEIKTELSTIYRLLGSLHDAQALTDGIDDGNAAAGAYGSYITPSRWTPWRDLFTLVRDNHAAASNTATVTVTVNALLSSASAQKVICPQPMPLPNGS